MKYKEKNWNKKKNKKDYNKFWIKSNSFWHNKQTYLNYQPKNIYKLHKCRYEDN